MWSYFISLIVILLLIQKTVSGIEVISVQCESQQNPIGIDVLKPHFSWKLASNVKGDFQTAFEVEVTTFEEELNNLNEFKWKSGKVISNQSVYVHYKGNPLESSKKYYWKVRVWDKNGNPSEWSPKGTFITGVLMPADWKARWVSGNNRQSLPIFRKQFLCKKKIKNAVVHVSGLGHFELFLNGEKVGNDFMAPAWSAYSKKIFYNTYDITEQLKQSNCFAIMLGNGFYNIPPDTGRYIKIRTDFGQPKFILQAEIQYDDGFSESIISNESWSVIPGPITYSSIYGGEDFDAQLEPEGWKTVGFDDKSWKKAVLVKPPVALLKAQLSSAVKVMDMLRPVSVKEVQPGIWLYDLGQNASAIPCLSVSGPKGEKILIKYGEQLNSDGTVNQDAITHNQCSKGKCSLFSYTLKGKGIETWQPMFVYSGFKYLQVEGAIPDDTENPESLPVIASLKSLHVRNSMPESGWFSCSDTLFNKIYAINLWSVKSNLNHVFTDCPHREKLGWLEQSYLMAPSVMYAFSSYNYFKKVIGDITDIQSFDGMVPTTAPDYNCGQFKWMFTNAPEWGSAIVITPWYHYLWFADTTLLEENYDNMKAWTDYLFRHSNNSIVNGTLGDWCDWTPDSNQGGVSKLTSADFVASASYVYCLNIVVKTAQILQKIDDFHFYNNLLLKAKEAINNRFFNFEKKYFDSNSQTANAMGLYMQLTSENNKAAVLANLINDLRSRRSNDTATDHMQTAGDIGSRYLLRALSENNNSAIVYEMTSRLGRGSYGNIVNAGFTTMPETWDYSTERSLNHCMLSHILEWFQRDIAGINPDADSPGFKNIVLKPEPVGKLNWAKGTYESAYGKVVSDWKIDKNDFIYHVEIPVNTTADVFLPVAGVNKITIDGKKLNDIVPEVSEVKEKNKTKLELGSGKYTIKCENFNK